MPKAKTPKKRNAPDLTLRNLHAGKTRLSVIEAELTRLEKRIGNLERHLEAILTPPTS